MWVGMVMMTVVLVVLVVLVMMLLMLVVVRVVYNLLSSEIPAYWLDKPLRWCELRKTMTSTGRIASFVKTHVSSFLIVPKPGPFEVIPFLPVTCAIISPDDGSWSTTC